MQALVTIQGGYGYWVDVPDAPTRAAVLDVLAAQVVGRIDHTRWHPGGRTLDVTGRGRNSDRVYTWRVRFDGRVAA